MDLDIQQVLNDAVQKGTFSLDAIRAIKEMKDENIELKNQSKVDAVAHNKTRSTLALCLEKNEELKDQFVAGQQRLVGVEQRENKMTSLECEVHRHKAVAEAVDNCFQRVFRNPVIQNETLRNYLPTGYYDDKGRAVDKELGHTAKHTTNEE